MKLIMIDSLGELKKGAWSPEEDQRLRAYVEKHGSKTWSKIPKAAGLERSGKSCRLRWVNYLRPDLKRGRLTIDEIETIITLHKSFGNQWTKIAQHLPGRTDNEIKNFWYLDMKKNSKSINKKNPCIKSNKPKRENRKMNKEDISLLSTHASDKTYSSNTNSSTSSSVITTTQSIDFPIIESYPSPTKDLSHQGSTRVQDSFGVSSFWTEDVIKSSSTSANHEIESPGTKATSQFDESTNFWLNILMNAERLEGK